MLNKNPFLIVIPSYNEEENLGKVLEELLQAALPADILVVNDGSSDETSLIARRYPVAVITHPCNLGYGAALQTGFQYASEKGYSYVIQFDADGQHDPHDIPAIMSALLNREADIIMGSRFLQGSAPFEAGFIKKAGIKFFKRLIYRLTGLRITDPTSGLRGLTYRVFHYYSVKGRLPADFPDADILIQMILLKFDIKEIPANMRQREKGASMHAGLKPIVYMLQIMLSVFIVLLRHKMTKRAA